MRRRFVAGLALAGSALFGLPPAANATLAAVDASCPSTTRADTVESQAALRADNQVESDYGPRPTASEKHAEFVNWIDGRLHEVPGLQVSGPNDHVYPIDRWLETGNALAAGPDAGSLAAVPTSGAVPYSHTTPTGGVTAPLVSVAPGTPLTAGVKDKVVVRDAVPGSVPLVDLKAVEWSEYDPDLSLAKATAANGVYERDFAGYQQRVDDLVAAAKFGAAALVFVHGFPRAQVQGQYAPYEGTHWGVPAVYVGADEGARLKVLAQSGGVANLSVSARDEMAPTRMVVATLPGMTSQRIVIESHTDGMNAVWDNGPIAMLALARHFAAQPKRCRPRTLQFVFTTAHIYQRLLGGQDRGGSSELEAKQVDKDFGRGSVAMVFALEHLGALEYAAVPRPDGGPGRVLQPTHQSEMNTLFVGESPALVAIAQHAVVARNMARTYILRGADAPAARIPVHNSFGGEGTAYQQHLVPSVALVTGPWTLYNPSFGMNVIDFGLMRTQTLVFADMIHAVGNVPQSVLGGGYLAERAARTAICASALKTLGFVRCAGDAYG